MQKADRARTRSEVANRVYQALASRGDPAVEAALSDAVYHEHRRLQHAHGVLAEEERAFWRRVQGDLRGAQPDALRRDLREAVDRHVQEIIGRFNAQVYTLATGVIPPALSLLLNPPSPRELLQRLPLGDDQLGESVVILGHTASLQRLHLRGRIILAPTHLSHLDAVVIGWVLHKLGLPPFIYGAGLNLFENPMLGFFMHNLGAYKVDRKKKHALYKDVLKEYCTHSLEIGYDNLFFPGGTRCRSGIVENHLKLGLLGCGLRAYQNNLARRVEQPNVYIVPATLSFHLVLEAETLIEDYLAEQGRSRYIIEVDESTQPRRVYDFVKNLIRLHGRIYCTLGRPLDPFGNEVDDDGRSRDGRGRPIELSHYVQRDGAIVTDAQRDQEYTRLLGQRVVESYYRENVILSTHLVARTLWTLMREHYPRMDLYRLLRSGDQRDSFPRAQVLDRLERLKSTVDQLDYHGRLRLDPRIARRGAEDVLDEACKHFSSYHVKQVLRLEGDQVSPQDRELLYYYQNRLWGYGLEDNDWGPGVLPPDGT